MSARGGSTRTAGAANKAQERKPGKEAVEVEVRVVQERTGGYDGSRRTSRGLTNAGHVVGRHQARGLMRKAGIEVCRRWLYRVTTDSRHRFPVAPNRLDRQFEVEAPNRAWGANITYLWTAVAWPYVGGGQRSLLAPRRRLGAG